MGGALFGALLLCMCVAIALIFIPTQRTSTPGSETPQADAKNPTLVIAHSPEKAALIKTLTDGFNAKRQKTPDGQAMEIRLLELTPEEMVNRALAGDTAFQAVTPDSSLWLDQLNRKWAQSQPSQGEGGAGAGSAIARTPDGRARPVCHQPDRHRGLGRRGPRPGLARPAGELEHAAEPRRRATPTSAGATRARPTPAACWRRWPSSMRARGCSAA